MARRGEVEQRSAVSREKEGEELFASPRTDSAAAPHEGGGGGLRIDFSPTLSTMEGAAPDPLPQRGARRFYNKITLSTKRQVENREIYRLSTAHPSIRLFSIRGGGNRFERLPFFLSLSFEGCYALIVLNRIELLSRE